MKYCTSDIGVMKTRLNALISPHTASSSKVQHSQTDKCIDEMILDRAFSMRGSRTRHKLDESGWGAKLTRLVRGGTP
jgi:hypothetical protein